MSRCERPRRLPLEEVCDVVAVHPVAIVGNRVMAEFGCNYEGDVEPRHVVTVPQRVEQKANACGSCLGAIGLADTMAWANPLQIKRLVAGEILQFSGIRERLVYFSVARTQAPGVAFPAKTTMSSARRTPGSRLYL